MSHNLDRSEDFLSPDEEKLLVTIARDALEAWVRHGTRLDLSLYPLTDNLRAHHGAFVTLRTRGELRGCIGSTRNTQPLATNVSDNAVNAASRDPRFNPVRISELSDLTIEVSALTQGDAPDTPFRRVKHIDEIVLGRDGLYIEKPPYRGGLLLPQVPLEQRWNRDQFLAAVCRKAGYPDRAWESPDTFLYRFSAQVFSE